MRWKGHGASVQWGWAKPPRRAMISRVTLGWGMPSKARCAAHIFCSDDLGHRELVGRRRLVHDARDRMAQLLHPHLIQLNSRTGMFKDRTGMLKDIEITMVFTGNDGQIACILLQPSAAMETHLSAQRYLLGKGSNIGV